ncbi:MAG: serine phosphatase RsbU (regulator of sigma subunit) [Flavobacteriales bacterium]|jgi:serine phosphatase RsbU (regulator of sigma subunit)
MKIFKLLLLKSFLLLTIVISAQTEDELKSKIAESDGAQKAAYNLQLANFLMDDKPADAFGYAKDGLTIAKDQSQPELISNAQALLSNISYELKKYDEAISYGKDAAKAFKGSDDKNYANIETIIADAYGKNGKSSDCIMHNELAFNVYIDLKKNKQAAYCASAIGQLYNADGETDNAVSWFNKAADNFDKAGKESDKVSTLRTIGAIYANFGDYEKARTAFEKAKSAAKKAGLSSEEKKIDSMLGQISDNEDGEIASVSDFQKGKEKEKEEIFIEIKNKNSKSLAEIESLSEELQLVEFKTKALQDEALINFLEKEKTEKQILLIAEEQKQKLTVETSKREALEAKGVAENEAAVAQRRTLYIIIGALAIVSALILIGLIGKQRTNKSLKAKNAEILKQKEEITVQRDEIYKKSENISQSIDYATRIQKAILPSPNKFSEVVSNSFILLRPKDNVSGDFFWYYQIGDELVIVAADCTGHGVPGAFMSIIFSTLLDKIVIDEGKKNPNEILESICNTLTSKLLGKDIGNTEFKDGMDVAIVTVNRKKKELLYSGARNPAYLIRQGKLLELKGTRRSVGILANTKKIPFELLSLDIEAKDRIFIFSDGFPDQKGGVRNKKYYYQPFKDLLVGLGDENMVNFPEKITQEYIAWKGDNEQFDDVLIVGVEID